MPSSIDTTLARIAEIQQAVSGRPVQQAAPGDASTTQTSAFAAQLASASGVQAPAAVVPAGGDPASRIVALAQQEVGVTEQPPGSNDGPRIAQYRQATAGAGVGPWCAFFTSHIAKEAGVPLGEAGQGFGLVDAVKSWSDRTGRTTQTPAPGELIVWDEHIGIVERVDPDGTIHTIEGNSSNAVSRRTYGPDGGGALGYVQLAAPQAATPGFAPPPVPAPTYAPPATSSLSALLDAPIVT